MFGKTLLYGEWMPRLWSDTIETHRRIVRDAALDAVGAAVAEGGLTSVTMSRIAAQSGIGRATLYKYFPDVDAILLAWHDRHVKSHLNELAEIRDQVADPGRRLHDVLERYAFITYERPTTALAVSLHAGGHLPHAEQHLHALIKGLLIDATRDGQVRGDITPDELATYCLHALKAAGDLTSKAATRRLLDLTLSALRSVT